MESSPSSPLVSIGLPVYNGEPYLSDTIASILRQTYRRLELIICDNASTDDTEAICRRYAAADSRIRYYRNSSNLGACRNYNLTFEHATGEYFKWAAADDIIEPEYIEKCVEVLRTSPDVVLCQSQVRVIDENGKKITDFDFEAGQAASASPARRLRDVMKHDRSDFEVFGVVRRDAMARTRLHDYYVGSDRVVRAELCLIGRFQILRERLFLNRDHPGRSVRALPAHHMRGNWYDPRLAGVRLFPHWRILREYGRAISNATLSPWQRFCCNSLLLRWIMQEWNWCRLIADVAIAIRPDSWRWLASLGPRDKTWLAVDAFRARTPKHDA